MLAPSARCYGSRSRGLRVIRGWPAARRRRSAPPGAPQPRRSARAAYRTGAGPELLAGTGLAARPRTEDRTAESGCTQEPGLTGWSPGLTGWSPGRTAWAPAAGLAAAPRGRTRPGRPA